MIKDSIRRIFCLVALVLFSGVATFADMGLQQILSSEGNRAVGLAVKAAAEDIFSSDENAEVIQAKLVAILNEAVATENEQTVRYVIVAIMMAGGVDNLELSKRAVDDSQAFDVFPEMTARTVSKMIWLLSGYKDIESGGDEQSGGGGGGESGGEMDLGGGLPREFDIYHGIDDLFNPEIDDQDMEATDT